EPAAGLGNRHVARRPAAAIIDVLEREALGQTRPHDRERKVLIEAALADVTERHHLDQRKFHAAPMRPLQQRREFFLVYAFERPPRGSGPWARRPAGHGSPPEPCLAHPSA